MPRPLKIIFAGTPEFAAQTLESILESNHEVVAVYTQPDRKSGRGKKISPSAVKVIATANSIPVFQPINFKETSDLTDLANINADLMVVVAYGILLPKQVLNTPKLGCINVHASLLPKWRGAAPIERSLLAGDSQTGVTIMQMDEGLDTGDMLNKITIAITDTMTSGELHDQLIPLGAQALLKTLDEVATDSLKPETQDNNLACYASKLFKTEGDIDWNLSGASIALKIRGLSPRPVASSSISNLVVRLWNATCNTIPSDNPAKPGEIISTSKNGIVVRCGNNTDISIKTIQLPGGKALSAQDLINSKKDIFKSGNLFSSITQGDNAQ